MRFLSLLLRHPFFRIISFVIQSLAKAGVLLGNLFQIVEIGGGNSVEWGLSDGRTGFGELIVDC